MIAAHELKRSAITPRLAKTATRLLHDLAIAHGGDVATPIAEALGFKYRRFGHQANQEQTAIAFINEDGSTWQAKIFEANRADGRSGQYSAPVKNGDRVYLPAIPKSVRQAIGNRWGVTVPETGSFWHWYETSDDALNAPLVITEGGKKSLSLLSQGYVAIALYGCQCGTKLNEQGERVLSDDLQRFVREGRQIAIAFDRDTSPKTKRAVVRGTARLASAFARAGCKVSIVSWDGRDGKGCDDLIANKGVKAFNRAFKKAKTVAQWAIQDRLENRLQHWQPQLTVNTASIDTVDLPIPNKGLVWIDSAKGTGKTKAIAKLVEGEKKVLSLGHRVALQRNLAARIGCEYIADLIKHDDSFIDRNGKTTQRVGLCFDSLLSIPIEQFTDGVLVLDEGLQGLRHLLTGSTCGKRGKRPALVARFIELVRAARRIVIADADISDWVISFIAAIRGDLSVFGVRNDYQPVGYPCDFYESSDDTAIVLSLLQDLSRGQKIFVATDSLRAARRIAKLAATLIGQDNILEINSKTTGSDRVKAFITHPDRWLDSYPEVQITIATPSLGTGASIEGDRFTKVYGLFYGVSILDNDAAQSLIRVRQPVPRAVWCAKHGSTYSKFGRDFAPFAITANIQKLVNATAHQLGSHLNADQKATINQIDWQGAIVTAITQIEADRNRSMQSFRDCLQVRLENEGQQVRLVESSGDRDIRAALKIAGQQVKIEEAIDIASAKNLDWRQAADLEKHIEALNPAQQNALEKFKLADWYALQTADVTLGDVLFDRDGRTRRGLARLEGMIWNSLSRDRDVSTIENLTQWGQPITPNDISYNLLRTETAKLLGIAELLEFVGSGDRWTESTPIVQDVAEKCRQYASDVKLILGFLPTNMTNNQIVGQILDFLGLKTCGQRYRHADGRGYAYRLDPEHLKTVQAILTRRHERRIEKGGYYCPTPLLKWYVLGGGTGMNEPPKQETSPSQIEKMPPEIPIDDPIWDEEF